MVEFNLSKVEGSTTLLKVIIITSLESSSVHLKSYFLHCTSTSNGLSQAWSAPVLICSEKFFSGRYYVQLPVYKFLLYGSDVMLRATWWCQLYNLKSVKNILFQPATWIKLPLLHGCFSRFLNCTNGAKSPKSSEIGWNYEIKSGSKYWRGV